VKLFSKKTRYDNDHEVMFAAAPIDATQPEEAAGMRDVAAVVTRVHRRAWKWFRDIGEIHFAVTRTARTAGYATLGVYERRPDGTPGRLVTGGIEGQVARTLISTLGGTRGLIERFFLHMKIPGDTWLIAVRENDAVVGYDFVAAQEWEKASLEALSDPEKVSPLKRITMLGSTNGSGSRYQEVQRRDVIGRVWRPDGLYMEMSDSPMAALDDTCDILSILTKGLRAKLKQRLMMQGILYVPQEINKAKSAAPKGKPGQFSESEVMNEIIKMMKFAEEHPDTPGSGQPVLLSGPGDQAHNLLFISPDRKVDEVEMKLRSELIDRILFGLDINPQGVKGSSDVSHWGAWAAADDEQRINVKPDLETLCWALTVLVLNRAMVDAGLPAGRISKRMVWYDLSRAVAKTNNAEDIRQAFDHGVVGPAANRRAAGATEADAPTAEEMIRMVGWKMDVPRLALHNVPGAEDLPWDEINSVKTGPAPKSTAQPSTSKPGVGDPGSPNEKTTKTTKPAK